jgi:hypothetical protein
MHIKDHSAAMKFFRTYDSAASKGKWKEFVDEMEFDSMGQEPRTMAQGPRMGLDDGGRIPFGDGLIVTEEIKAQFPEGWKGKYKNSTYGFAKSDPRWEQVRSKTRTEERALYNQRAEVKEMRRKVQKKAYEDPIKKEKILARSKKYISQPEIAAERKKYMQKRYYEGGQREKDLARLKGKIISENLGAYLQSPDNVLINDMIRAAKTDSNLKVIRGGPDNTVVAVQEGEKIYHAVGSNRKPVPGSPNNSTSIIKHPWFEKRSAIVKQQKEFKHTKVPNKDITYGEALDVLESKKAKTPIQKKNPAEFEHVKGVAVDYKKGQIALRTANREKQKIMTALKNEHMTRAEADKALKKLGVRDFYKGKYIGAPKINPEKQFEDLKKYVDRKINVDKSFSETIRPKGSGVQLTIVGGVFEDLLKSKAVKGFKKVGGPWEAGFIGLDFMNNLEKGMDTDTSFQVALSNATLGMYEGGKRAQWEDFETAGKELGHNPENLNEVKSIVDLEKMLIGEKKQLEDLKAYANSDESTLQEEELLNIKERIALQETLVSKLENKFNENLNTFWSKDNANDIVDNYDSTVNYVARKEYNETVEDRKLRVDPNAGKFGSQLWESISDWKTYLPQNLMETTDVTRPYVRALRKLPGGLGDIWDPTSEQAKLSAMSAKEIEQRAKDLNIQEQYYHPVLGDTMTSQQLEPYRERYYAEGGIASLMKKK